jgi:hypothetical protein
LSFSFLILFLSPPLFSLYSSSVPLYSTATSTYPSPCSHSSLLYFHCVLYSFSFHIIFHLFYATVTASVV